MAAGAAYATSRLRPPRRIDFWMVLAVAFLMLVGFLSIYSVDYVKSGSGQFKKQVINTLIGLGPFALFYFVDPSMWRRAAKGIYVANVLILLLVLKMGSTVKGATRWIEIGPLQFQPSELAKLFMVLTMASFFASRLDRIDKISTYALSFLHLAVPLILVYKQPHLGASLVLVTIWLAISLAAGVRLRFVFGSVLAVVMALGIAFSIPGVLSDYQKNRVIGLFEKDEKGKGYQALRAQIAFGVGGLTGTGYLQGQQKQGGFIPEQHNDFIFTVIGEEGGLAGCTMVLAAFGLLFYRIWLVLFEAAEPYYRMVAAGILGLLAFHTIANIGMNLQLLPVVGLWLPFLSSGGTAMWLCLACIGLLLNIHSRRRESMF
ncbi:MAG: FtsW/RodA/SpoVE family cell cycle protein [Fimbriimonadales bacterium]